MFVHPDINPIALQFGPLKVRWYGLMYVLGFLLAWLLGNYRAKQANSGWDSEQVSDVIFYGALGVILGGRIGYMLFYNLPELLNNPLSLFKVWDGGMSFHGGLLGVLFAVWLFARKTQKTFLGVTDFVAPLVPLGLAAGRIGNFINGELWGRVTQMPWGMIFPYIDNQPRHPSQFYEFFLEGICLFIIVWFYSAKPRTQGAVSGVFVLAYGIFRCIAELFRQPDPQYGYLAFGWVTMGQILSIPMIAVGVVLLWRSAAKKYN